MEGQAYSSQNGGQVSFNIVNIVNQTRLLTAVTLLCLTCLSTRFRHGTMFDKPSITQYSQRCRPIQFTEHLQVSNITSLRPNTVCFIDADLLLCHSSSQLSGSSPQLSASTRLLWRVTGSSAQEKTVQQRRKSSLLIYPTQTML